MITCGSDHLRGELITFGRQSPLPATIEVILFRTDAKVINSAAQFPHLTDSEQTPERARQQTRQPDHSSAGELYSSS